MPTDVLHQRYAWSNMWYMLLCTHQCLYDIQLAYHYIMLSPLFHIWLYFIKNKISLLLEQLEIVGTQLGLHQARPTHGLQAAPGPAESVLWPPPTPHHHGEALPHWAAQPSPVHAPIAHQQGHISVQFALSVLKLGHRKGAVLNKVMADSHVHSYVA